MSKQSFTSRQTKVAQTKSSAQEQGVSFFSDYRPVGIAQAKMAANIAYSPKSSIQRKAHERMFGTEHTTQLMSEEEELLQGKFANSTQLMSEEEELLQGKFANPLQLMSEEEELLQGKFNQQTLQKKEQTSKPNQTGLPDNLKSGIENLSGYSMDDVKVHYNSNKPAQLQAHAYAQGTDIHLASGQEKHLPHEAWHVVQQKQGRVKPTIQMKGGVNVNDDIGLEKEADVMGAKALNTKENLSPKEIKTRTFQKVIQKCPINQFQYIYNKVEEIKAKYPITYKFFTLSNVGGTFDKYTSLNPMSLIANFGFKPYLTNFEKDLKKRNQYLRIYGSIYDLKVKNIEIAYKNYEEYGKRVENFSLTREEYDSGLNIQKLIEIREGHYKNYINMKFDLIKENNQLGFESKYTDIAGIDNEIYNFIGDNEKLIDRTKLFENSFDPFDFITYVAPRIYKHKPNSMSSKEIKEYFVVSGNE